MFWAIVTLLALVVLTAIGVLFLRPLRNFGREIQGERAQELFRLERERLEPQFLPAAQGTGKPRGLRWKECAFNGDVVFARERQGKQLIALVGVTIQFEAIEGGDMEGLPAVGNLRNASAVFYFQRGHWHTAGKAVFNMNPGEALNHFQKQYVAIPTPADTSSQANSRPEES